MTKTKIQIKRNYSGTILFEYKKENNTLKDTVIEAVKNRTDLRYAYLYKADLRGADLREANLNSVDLSYADLRGANLYDADLSCAYIYKANLRGARFDAYLRGAILSGANLRDTDLSGADLRGARFDGANLYNADLRDTDLNGADFRDADLSGADLSGADLSGANLRGAKLTNTKGLEDYPLACPEEGSFIAWKKVVDKLVKLEIPEDARRSSATTNKCRCDKAKVLAITDLDGSNPITEIENLSWAHRVTYKVGEMVYPDSFDEDRWNECSHGIHFFINKLAAINY